MTREDIIWTLLALGLSVLMVWLLGGANNAKLGVLGLIPTVAAITLAATAEDGR